MVCIHACVLRLLGRDNLRAMAVHACDGVGISSPVVELRLQATAVEGLHKTL